MRWPRSRREELAIQVTDDLARWRSDFDEPLPPVTRNELLRRLGMDVDDGLTLRSVSSRKSDVEAIAAA